MNVKYVIGLWTVRAQYGSATRW